MQLFLFCLNRVMTNNVSSFKHAGYHSNGTQMYKMCSSFPANLGVHSDFQHHLEKSITHNCLSVSIGTRIIDDRRRKLM